MEIQDFVETVKTERKKRGLSQYKLAKECGVSREMISKLERGMHNPKLDTILFILKRLGLELVVKKAKRGCDT